MDDRFGFRVGVYTDVDNFTQNGSNALVPLAHTAEQARSMRQDQK
jgi:hypothetical protein